MQRAEPGDLHNWLASTQYNGVDYALPGARQHPLDDSLAPWNSGCPRQTRTAPFAGLWSSCSI